MMIVKMSLYSLKISGAAFRAKLAVVLKDIQYQPTKTDPDFWIRPEICKDVSEYYKMVLCYVDEVLAILTDPKKTIDGINQVFKLKGYKADPPYVYLGAYLQTVETSYSKTCWEISSEKYVRAAVINVEEWLS